MEKKNTKMNTKKALVSFLVIASVLFLATAVSAADIADDYTIKVNGEEVDSSSVSGLSVIAGETVAVKVTFTALEDASDVRLRVEFEGDKADVVSVTPLFDVETGKIYVKVLTIKVPSDLKDELSDDLTMNVKISNSDYETEIEDILLNVQRVPYDLAIKSISTDGSVVAGETLPVEVVLKNVGYDDADDVYVTVSIPELNVQKSAYLGDLVSLEDCDDECDDDDETDTISAVLKIGVPYNAVAGSYTLTVTAENDETVSTVSKEITIANSVSELVVKSGNDLILLNPTSQFKTYKVTYNSNEVVNVVSAGSSIRVPITVPAGDYNFDVVVTSADQVVSTVNFSGSSNSNTVQLTNPVFVLTVILAVVFLVLLVVLVVLITKKPQKTEEFGESYY